MGSRKGMRAQEQQAQRDRELSGAGAGFREPDGTSRRSIETPTRTKEEAPHSAIGSNDDDESDDIQQFDDDVEEIDDENDLA